MSSILDKIVAHKIGEIAAAKSLRPLAEIRAQAESQTDPRDFLEALKNTGRVSLIAEVKKASPSKGVIRADFDPVTIAKIYRDNGASCLSVLTDEFFFQGHLDFLRAVRSAVDLPLLRKDFVLDEYQIIEARAAGADAVLLIAECLEAQQMKQLHNAICDWGMTPLVEFYDQENIAAVLRCDPKLVGVNNRDLKTFEVDLHHSIRMKQQLPSTVTMVSESGISNSADVKLLQRNGIEAILVGESLMRADDIGAAVRKLLN